MAENTKDKLYEQQGKQQKYYDRTSQPLKPLKPLIATDSVCMRTDNGWQTAGVTRHAEQPRSFYIQKVGCIYSSNCKDLRQMNEHHAERAQVAKEMVPLEDIGVPEAPVVVDEQPPLQQPMQQPMPSLRISKDGGKVTKKPQRYREDNECCYA